jgi:hypothetical protein
MMMRVLCFFLGLVPFALGFFPALTFAQDTPENVGFRVKYIAEGVVYLDAGRAMGLKEGQRLIVQRDVAPQDNGPAKPVPPSSAPVIASLKVLSVAASSSVCEIISRTEPVQVDDFVRVAPEVAQQVQQVQKQERLVAGREYPQVITFTGGDPALQEMRDSVPRPPTPDVNQMQGRIGVEYSTVTNHGSFSSTSSEIGMVARFDMTRIGSTYWNFNGYWRGTFSTLTGAAVPATVDDLINRTYTLSMEYNNPNSRFVAGAGRLYLPWATSLDVIDGGYAGRKVGDRTTLGIFAGTTPDPTSYDYNPQGKLSGTFVNIQGGSYQDWRYSSTFGIGLAAIGWHATRQFGFTDISVSFKHTWSIYDATEIDVPHTVVVTPTGTTGTTAPPTSTTGTGGLNRSYVTMRYQPTSRVELDLNDTYYRDFPTFDPALIGTGLLDQYLFQGLSGGGRFEILRGISVYTEVGKSSASTDTNGSWNQLYGLTFGDLGHTGIRTDVRYSKFNSSFGNGDYKAVSLTRELNAAVQFEVQAGFQNFNSTLTNTSQTHFVDSNVDWSVGKWMFFEAGYTWQRGGTMNYDQMRFMIGRRF